MDRQGTHCRKMKNAVWLFLYLLLNADRKTGTLARKVMTIASDMGVGKDTIVRWLVILRAEGYIASESNGRCLIIRINRWKPPDVGNMHIQNWQTSKLRSFKYPNSQSLKNRPFEANFSQKTATVFDSNERTITKLFKNIDTDNNSTKVFKPERYGKFQPESREELLAMDLARGLNDEKGLPLYLFYSRKYPEQLLRRILSEVKEMPSDKIKKSRGALFNYLIQQYDKQHKQTSNNTGN